MGRGRGLAPWRYCECCGRTRELRRVRVALVADSQRIARLVLCGDCVAGSERTWQLRYQLVHEPPEHSHR